MPVQVLSASLFYLHIYTCLPQPCQSTWASHPNPSLVLVCCACRLLLGRDVGRVETLQLARQLMELHADRLQDFLGAMASINLQAVLDPDDIHSLLQQAVELR